MSSYGREETLDEKIERLESQENLSFSLIRNISPDDEYNLLYHGIRFDQINRLEGIFKFGKVFSGKRVPKFYESSTGEEKELFILDYGNENANKGEYVSVMPYEINSLEFKTFIAKYVYLAFKGNIPAVKAHYLPYNEYDKVSKKNNLKRLYSYAEDEYMVKDEIDLDNLAFIGVNFCYQSDDEIDKIIDLMKYYEIKAPLIEHNTHKVIYEFQNNKSLVKTQSDIQ